MLTSDEFNADYIEVKTDERPWVESILMSSSANGLFCLPIIISVVINIDATRPNYFIDRV